MHKRQGRQLQNAPQAGCPPLVAGDLSTHQSSMIRAVAREAGDPCSLGGCEELDTIEARWAGQAERLGLTGRGGHHARQVPAGMQLLSPKL